MPFLVPMSTLIRPQLEPCIFIRHLQDNPVGEYAVPEMTYKLCPTRILTHHLKLKKGVPGMVIRNVLHPTQVNGKMFAVKAHRRIVVQVAAVDSSGNNTA